MAIVINGSGTVTGITGITGTNATVTGITSVASNAANTAVVLQDSGSNSNTCRAWVNFKGTGTVAIRASFNVSSITDNGTGQYTVNFTVAMLDTNYCTVLGGSGPGAAGTNKSFFIDEGTTPTTTSIRLLNESSNGTDVDADYNTVAVFR